MFERSYKTEEINSNIDALLYTIFQCTRRLRRCFQVSRLNRTPDWSWVGRTRHQEASWRKSAACIQSCRKGELGWLQIRLKKKKTKKKKKKKGGEEDQEQEQEEQEQEQEEEEQEEVCP